MQVIRTCCPKSMKDSSTWVSESLSFGCTSGDEEDECAVNGEAGDGRGGVGFWGSVGSMPSSRSAATLLCSSFAALVCSLYNIRNVLLVCRSE
jgi:hypothetical protein